MGSLLTRLRSMFPSFSSLVALGSRKDIIWGILCIGIDEGYIRGFSSVVGIVITIHDDVVVLVHVESALLLSLMHGRLLVSSFHKLRFVGIGSARLSGLSWSFERASWEFPGLGE